MNRESFLSKVSIGSGTGGGGGGGTFHPGGQPGTKPDSLQYRPLRGLRLLHTGPVNTGILISP